MCGRVRLAHTIACLCVCVHVCLCVCPQCISKSSQPERVAGRERGTRPSSPVDCQPTTSNTRLLATDRPSTFHTCCAATPVPLKNAATALAVVLIRGDPPGIDDVRAARNDFFDEVFCTGNAGPVDSSKPTRRTIRPTSLSPLSLVRPSKGIMCDIRL